LRRRTEVVGFVASIDGSLLCSDLPAQDGAETTDIAVALLASTKGALSTRESHFDGLVLYALNLG
jgi:hypothetical protein